MNPSPRIGVLLLNFGEPETYDYDEVVSFLERIFNRNSSLESTAGNPNSRTKELAKQRAPSLIEEYEAMGASPLNLQARQQATKVEKELRKRMLNSRCYSGTQFTEPFINTGCIGRRAKRNGPVCPGCSYKRNNWMAQTPRLPRNESGQHYRVCQSSRHQTAQ